MSLLAACSRVSQRILALFTELMNPSAGTQILDVGAEVDPAGTRTLQFIGSCPWKDPITAINLSAEHMALIQKQYPQIHAVVAKWLPWHGYFRAGRLVRRSHIRKKVVGGGNGDGETGLCVTAANYAGLGNASILHAGFMVQGKKRVNVRGV